MKLISIHKQLFFLSLIVGALVVMLLPLVTQAQQRPIQLKDGNGTPYSSTTLPSEYRVVPAMLDGDDKIDFLVIEFYDVWRDAYQESGCDTIGSDLSNCNFQKKWTSKIHAYSHDGNQLWFKDTGVCCWMPGNGEGVVATAWDVEPGGQDEIIALINPNYNPSDPSSKYSIKDGQGDLVILDGLTGNVIRSTPWPKANRFERHHMAIAYLDGSTPSIITQTGLYCPNERLVAFNANDLSVKWDINTNATSCGGNHNFLATDIDGDDKDEVIHGTSVFNGDGTFRWDLEDSATGLSSSETKHADITKVADFDPSITGLEIMFCVEQGTPGAYLTSFDGTLLWGKRGPSFVDKNTHCHSGFVGDIDKTVSGIEIALSNRNGDRFGWYADGTQKNTLYTDGRDLFDAGNNIFIGDIIGDFGDEKIIPRDGQLIFSGGSTVGPPTGGSAYIMSGTIGRNYRQAIVRSGTGYWYRQPLPGEGNSGAVLPPPICNNNNQCESSIGENSANCSTDCQVIPMSGTGTGTGTGTGGGPGTPDLNDDQRVDYADLAILLSQWGTSGGSQATGSGGTTPEVGIIIDNVASNNNAGQSFSTVGTWQSSQYPNPYLSNSIWASVLSGSTDTATWSFNIDTAGEYEVAAWWTSGAGRVKDATYRITHANGADDVVVCQQEGGGRWNTLGTYTFNVGQSTVKLFDTSANPGSVGNNDSVGADAIWVAPKGQMTGASAPPDPATCAASSGGSGNGTIPGNGSASVGGEVPPAGFRVAYIADMGIASGGTSVLDLIARNNVQAVVIAGDLGYEETDPATPRNWSNLLSSKLPGIPVFSVIGNHDEGYWDTVDGYSTVIAEQIADAESSGAVCSGTPGLNYECTYKGIQLVFSGSQSTRVIDGGYIDSVLSTSQTPWKVCSWHYNQREMQAGGKSNEAGWGGYQACQSNGAFILNGHEHSYSRTKTLNNIGIGDHGPQGSPDIINLKPGQTSVVVSGIGGASKRDYHCEVHEPLKSWWASIFTSNFWLKNGVDQGNKNCTLRQPVNPNDPTRLPDWEDSITNYDFGALFVEYNVGGDPYKAMGEFKTIADQTIDTFEIVLQDTFAPTINSFTMASRASDQPVVVNWDVNDHKGLLKVELQVTDDLNGSANSSGWTTVSTNMVQAQATSDVGTDTHDPANGKWWYRILVTDTSGNTKDSNSITAVKQPVGTSNTLTRLADSVITRTAAGDYWVRSLQSDHEAWNWDVAVRYYGMWRAYEATGDVAYYNYVKKYLDDNIDSNGVFSGKARNGLTITKPRKANEVAPFYLALEMYEETGDQRYLTASLDAANVVCNEFPRTTPRIGSAWQGCGSNAGGFDHNGAETPQEYWLDTIFMTGAFLAKMGTITGNAKYYDEAANQVIVHIESLKNTSFTNSKGVAGSFLLYHAWDKDGNADWILNNNSTNPTTEYWGRGNAWVPAAIVDILGEMPDSHPKKDVLKTYLRQHLSAVAQVQDSGTGRWWTMLNKGGQSGNYLESSATALFLYAMQTAIDRGYVSGMDYAVEVDKALRGLLAETIEVNGLTEFRNVSAGTIPGNYAYYTGRQLHSNVNWGDGVALMAYSRFNGDSRIATISDRYAVSNIKQLVLGDQDVKDTSIVQQKYEYISPRILFSFIAVATGFALLLGVLVRKRS